MTQATKNGILWIDVETTGLIPGKDLILEIAYIFTDIKGTFLEARSRLVELRPEDQEQFFHFTVGQSYSFVRAMHTKNGLIKDFFNPETVKSTMEEIITEMWNIQESIENGTGINFWYLGGSSVHTDRNHIEAWGHKLPVSHRHMDVSSLKLFADASGQTFYQDKNDDRAHRAYDDILEDVKNYAKFVEKNKEIWS